MASERPQGAPRPTDAGATPERQPVPARWLALASAGVAALLVLVALVAYRQLLYYQRRAIEHVPAGAELALRVDLEQVLLFEPVRRHLLPLLDRAALGELPASTSPSRLVRLRQAGLNLGLDLREVVFAQMQPGAGWLLALGGIFGSEPLLPGIERVLREEPGTRLRSQRGMITFEPSGVVLAEADDGVLLLASDAALLERASPRSLAHEEVGLSAVGSGALGALGSWLDRLGAESAEPSTAAASPLRVSARLTLGEPLEVTVDIEHREPIDIAAVRREIQRWLGTPSDEVNFAPEADWGGERALAARAQLTQVTPVRVIARTSWTLDELDRAVTSLAAWLEPRIRAAGPPAH